MRTLCNILFLFLFSFYFLIDLELRCMSQVALLVQACEMEFSRAKTLFAALVLNIVTIQVGMDPRGSTRTTRVTLHEFSPVASTIQPDISTFPLTKPSLAFSIPA